MARKGKGKGKGKAKRRSVGLVRIVMWVVGAAGVVLAAGAGALTLLGMPSYDVPKPKLTVAVTPERVTRGKQLVSMLCNRCHFDGDVRALSGRELEEVSPRVGKVSAPNITRDEEAGIGTWSAVEVAVLLRTGIHPKTGVLVPPPVMPRWPGLDDEDLLSILAFLQSEDPWVAPRSEEPPPSRYSLVSKWKALVDWAPLPYPRAHIEAPARDDLEARGEYLVGDVLQCGLCHSDPKATFVYDNPRETLGYLAGGREFQDLNDVVLRAANLTPHETGLAGWTTSDVRRALTEGFGPDGKVVRWPLHRHAGLDDRDIEAIYIYLMTVAPVANELAPSPPYRMIGRKADEGRHLYLLHGCHYCHRESDGGASTFQGVDERFATDEALTAYLRDPAQHDPFTLMPPWEGVIAEEDYPAMCAYIRERGRVGREKQEKATKAKGGG